MDNWNDLRAECLACQKCGLAKQRKHVVFGDGSETAEVLFIGEGPGANEDEQGLPFVGKAGALLDDMLKMIGLSRADVFITNSVKCRPPENRDPLNVEKDACRPWLKRQINLIEPKIIVCLGRIAAMELIKEDFRITKEHGQWFERDGVFYMATYHPSALLRDETKRPDAFMDLRALRKKIREVSGVK